MKELLFNEDGYCNKNVIAILVFLIILVVSSSVLKFKTGEECDYRNSDATWHTLLTIKAYDETPFKQHLFLPIVSLGRSEDKGIPWGATIPDSEGNYYYTSFSAAGFFLPWLFIKVLSLPIEEKSLYLFNSFLFLISVLLWVFLLGIIYENCKYKHQLCLIGGVLYALTPEVLHGMGIVYWHQSILQVTLLLQIIVYYQFAYKGSVKSKCLFYILALINPYIEWTGYIANMGFAVAEITINYKNGWSIALKKAGLLGLITIVSFVIFSAQYLLRVDFWTFVYALKNRFMSRNITTTVLLTDLFGSYFKSFLYLWLFLIVVLIWCFVQDKKLEIDYGIIILLLAFPIVENIIMKQHALVYTYDRMKASFVLIFIICEICRNILEKNIEKNVIGGLIALSLCISTYNLLSYLNDTTYVWRTNYKVNNRVLANYITKEYPDALYASRTIVRGYMNLLFDRGIYECLSAENAIKKALKLGKTETVFINTETINGESYKIETITIFNNKFKTSKIYSVKNGVIINYY